jgi:hypothetical protein
MKRLAILAAFVLILGGLAPSKTAQAQQCPIAQHCFTCTARGAQALYRAGDPRQVRTVRNVGAAASKRYNRFAIRATINPRYATCAARAVVSVPAADL